VEFGWSEKDYANIVMAFTAAYALGLLVFGRIIDKIGTKMGFSISIVFWSIAACLHGVVKTTFGFGIARAALGLGESGNFPAAIKTVAEWFPKKERALATGIFNSGANIGAVFAPILVPTILALYGWQEAFIITGAIGFVWLIFWLYYYEIPTRHKKVTEAELAHIHSDNEEDTSNEKPITWGTLFRVRQTYVFIAGKLLTDPIWWFFLFWLPSYFSTSFNLDLKKPGWPLVIIYMATSIGSIGGGYLSSYFIQKGWPVYKARKTAMFIFALCVLPIMSAKYATNMWVAVALISLAAAAHQAWSANIFTVASDMFPKKAISSVVGIGGMAGSIGGVLFPIFVGYILETYKLLGDSTSGYNIIFFVCGLMYMLAWAVMHFISPKMTPYKE
jgi:ACS family hexuronate transporter-like MFS transporter